MPPHLHTYPDQPDQPIPRSTHNPNQPRPSKPTQTKTDPHHKLRLNHHRGLPTSLPSIINSNPHHHHRDHATCHALISPRCDPQRRSRHAGGMLWTREREMWERERELRMKGWDGFFVRERENAQRLREWEWESSGEEREKIIKKLNTRATVLV